MSAKGEPSVLNRAAAALSALVPFAMALVHLPSGATWEGDVALLRGLAVSPMPGAGGVTTLLLQLAFLLPVGSLAFRAALLSAAALGLAGFFVYALAGRLLLANLRTPRLAPILAATASLSATLAGLLQTEATLAGGASVALALGAMALWLLARAPGADTRTYFVVGAALGLCLVENVALGGVLLLAYGAHAALSTPRPSAKGLAVFAMGTACAVLLPTVAPLFANDESGARGFLAGKWLFLESQRLLPSPQLLDAGVLAWAFGLGGLLFGVAQPQIRPFAAALVVFVLADALLPTRPVALSSMALVAVFVLAALGMQTGAAWLLAKPTRANVAAVVLLVMLNVSLVAMAVETRLFAMPSRSQQGLETVTRAALDELPPRAIVLVRSEALARRLWAARLEEGARPDVVIVPTARLADVAFASRLLDEEAAAVGFVRDVAMDGRPKEHSLTTLADARPLLVEFDPRWDERLVGHLVAEGPWLRFAPQPLGRSDRERAFANALPLFERIRLAATKDDGSLDPATAEALTTLLRGHAASAGLLGDRDVARALLRELADLAPNDPLVAELGHWLASPKSAFRLQGRLP